MVIHYQISKDANFTCTAEIDEMIEVVSTYNAALKAASLPDIMAVFMQDAVLLPENQPPIAGVKNIKSVYDELVRLIKFNDDNIVNIVEAYTAGDCGFVRSHRTHGSITEIHTGEKKNPLWRELWVFKRDADNKLKFAVYAYGNAPAGEFDPIAAVLW